MPLNEDFEDILDEIDNDADEDKAAPAPQPPAEQAPEPAAADLPPFPEEPPFGGGNDAAADLVDDLAAEDTEEEPEYNTEESFAPSKKVKNTKKIMQITALVAGAAILLIVTVIPTLFQKEQKTEEGTAIVDSEEILKQMKEYDERDIKRQEERKPRGEIQEKPLPKTAAEQQPQQQSQRQGSGTARPRNTASGGGHNAKKDEEILRQYAEVDPAAAAAASGDNATNNKIARLNALPARQGGGGLNVIGGSETKTEKASVYDIELKAKLKFGVRSSGGNSVVATITEGKSDFPEGAIFYGTATFNNKRTFVRFTHAQAGERKIVLDGRAMQGKDPGLPSEVTEIAGQNAESSLKSGAIGVAGQVADNALSNLTQGATKGVLNDSTKDLQKEQEEQKKQYEYFVPAGTTFTIYVY